MSTAIVDGFNIRSISDKLFAIDRMDGDTIISSSMYSRFHTVSANSSDNTVKIVRADGTNTLETNISMLKVEGNSLNGVTDIVELIEPIISIGFSPGGSTGLTSGDVEAMIDDALNTGVTVEDVDESNNPITVQVSLSSLYSGYKTLASQLQNLSSLIQGVSSSLTGHIEGDSLRWQQIGDAIASMYGSMVEVAQEVYAGTLPEMDTTRPTQIYGSGGLLTLDAGGQWTAPVNGFIVVVYQAILGVAPVLLKNDTAVDYGSLSILGSGTPSAPIQVNSGDVLTATGSLGLGSSFNVTFYPNK